jgi:hypothetical protein
MYCGRCVSMPCSGALFGLCCGAHLDDLSIASRARARHPGYSRRCRHEAVGASSEKDPRWGKSDRALRIHRLQRMRLGTKGRVGSVARREVRVTSSEAGGGAAGCCSSATLGGGITVKMRVLRMADGRIVSDGFPMFML